MPAPIYIIGGTQTDFAHNWSRHDQTLFDMFSHTLLSGLSAARLSPREIDVGHVGNFVAELFTGQGMLGGWFAHVDEGFAGMPASRHEGACASGSLAVLAAMADIESGRYEAACVLGIEMMRNVPGQTAADYLGAAAWVGREAPGADYVWPSLFSDLAQAYDERYGLERAHLAEISKINFANAKKNPNAQTRGWTLSDESFAANDYTNPVIEGWMRKHDCGQVSDGAAIVFLASEKFARDHAQKQGRSLDDYACIKGWGHSVAPMMLSTKLNTDTGTEYTLPWTRKAIVDAYSRAGIRGPSELNAIETHDCFSITEYMAIEHFGLTAPGKAWQAIEDGVIAMNGQLPINPSGGLIGLGHPVGATGVRMILDASKQVTNSAGDYQVDNARTVATYNVGGSGTTNCAFIIGRT